jgi:hypothetical protein
MLTSTLLSLALALGLFTVLPEQGVRKEGWLPDAATLAKFNNQFRRDSMDIGDYSVRLRGQELDWAQILARLASDAEDSSNVTMTLLHLLPHLKCDEDRSWVAEKVRDEVEGYRRQIAHLIRMVGEVLKNSANPMTVQTGVQLRNTLRQVNEHLSGGP